LISPVESGQWLKVQEGGYARRIWRNKAGVNDPPTGRWWDLATVSVAYVGQDERSTNWKLVGFANDKASRM
jgi:hypothetical protein